jgi:hypothetical protein
MADGVVLLGLVLIVFALWLLLDWPGVLLWAGALFIIFGVAEARRTK